LSKNTEPTLRTHKGREAAAKAAHHTTEADSLEASPEVGQQAGRLKADDTDTTSV